MGKKERRKMRRKVGKNRPLIRLASGQPPSPQGEGKKWMALRAIHEA